MNPGPVTSDALGLIHARLGELGLCATAIEHRDGRGSRPSGLTVRFIGRDPAGHEAECRLDITLTDDLEQVARSIEAKLSAHARSAARVRHHPPVQPGPEMPLGHLDVYAPFARRLRMDHGDDAPQALRETLLIFLQGKGKKLNKHPRPYGLVLDANRVDHREDLSEGVRWLGRSLVVHGTILPDQILTGLVGAPITRIVEHPLLDKGMTITRAFSEASVRKGGGVTVFETAGEWIPGDRV